MKLRAPFRRSGTPGFRITTRGDKTAMILERFEVGPFLENTYVIGDEATGEAYIVDPGGENRRITAFIEKKNLKPLAIICTHGHIDHIAGAAELQKLSGLPLKIHHGDEALVGQAPLAARMFGIPAVEIPQIDGFFEEGDVLKAGSVELRVIHTPGHSMGGVCFLGDGFILAGDTLFQMSIGRTDLPGGSYKTLLASIKEKLLTLPDDTVVYPGHGPSTSIGFERENNPFL